GLIVDGDESLLVDTLFDAPLTRDMLKTMHDATGIRGDQINTVVNTHANGDHTHGNGLCTNAEVIASEASAREMEFTTPETLKGMMDAAPALGETGEYFQEIFGPFNFGDCAEKLPTRTFNDQLQLKVGDRDVELLEVGPAHTAGDVLVFVDGDQAVFTGDILFIDGTPIMWNGPVSNWLKACDLIIDRNPAVIVPGHGPITDLKGVERVKEYLAYIDKESRKRYDAGMSVRDAAHDISLDDFESWTDAERIAVNVNTLYREYSDDRSPPDIVQIFGLMAEIHRSQRK
ncbi:MAG: MBL fold metallo-hydrolase, partial [Proteobacteria bacterium]|nr:MBL fold metallo-hydrolase [Pseudomonadota bacterium]